MRAAGRTLTLEELLTEIIPTDRPETLTVRVVNGDNGDTYSVERIEVDRRALRPAVLLTVRVS